MNRDKQLANTSSQTAHPHYAAQNRPVTVSRDRAQSNQSRALLVFAHSADLDCDQRKWPPSFRQLFSTERFAELAASNIEVHLFTPVAPHPQDTGSVIHVQRYTKHSFGRRLENAVQLLATSGFSEIVIVGSDCPSLTRTDVLKAFELLDRKRAVLGPDHQGGCYLIGIHADDRPDFAKIRWHKNTDFRQILHRYGENAIAQLPTKIDIDTLRDLQLLARSSSLGNALAAALLHMIKAFHCVTEAFLSVAINRHLAVSWQLPPPFLSAL